MTLNGAHLELLKESWKLGTGAGGARLEAPRRYGKTTKLGLGKQLQAAATG